MRETDTRPDTEFTIDEAHSLAILTLSDCYIPGLGIVAGQHHFTDLWRDSLIASMAAHRNGLAEASRDTLKTFLDNQRRDGLVPYRILRSPHTIGKFLGKEYPEFNNPKPQFRNFLRYTVPDTGLWTIITFRDYLDQTDDEDFLLFQHFNLYRLMDWYPKHNDPYNHNNVDLISEGIFCGWEDATIKWGKTLYTNVLYTQALRDMAFLSEWMGHNRERKDYRESADFVREKVNKTFWNGQFFSDWADRRRHDIFSSISNMLALQFDIADEEQANKVLDFVEQNGLWTDFTLETNYEAYPKNRLQWGNRLAGFEDYYNYGGCLWLEPGILYVMNLAKYGRQKEAEEKMEAIRRQIVRHGGYHEIYERTDGHSPVYREKHFRRLKKTFKYSAEHPFPRSAAFYLLAQNWERRYKDSQINE